MAYRGSKEHFNYINDWRAKKKRPITFYIDKERDKDILDKLDSVGNKTEYIRQLIRNDIKCSP